MAQFDITAPDGKKYRVTAPDGASQEQVLAYAQSQFSKPQESKLPGVVNYSPVAGAVEGALNLASGTAGAVAGGLSGLGTAATNALGLTNTPPGDRVAQVSEALTYQPRTAAGKLTTEVVAAPFEALAKVADKAGGATTDVTGSPTAGAAVNTLIQSVPMVIGKGAKALPGESPAAIAARQRAQVANAPAEATVAAAREAGLKLTPQDAGGGAVSRGLAGLSGEPKLAKLASKKNAPTVNDMIRRDVGLADDMPLTREALLDVIKEEGGSYAAVKEAGRFDTDAKYRADLDALTEGFDTAAKDFAHRKENPVQKIMEGLKVKDMDAASAIEEVKNLRADADKAYRAGDKQAGSIYKNAANVLDDQLDRHLKTLGDSEGVTKYRASRRRIAKSYAALDALNEATGNIDAAVYAKKRRDRVPLDGEAAKVADFATAFPRSLQRTERLGATGPTYFDLLLGGGAGIMGTMLGGAPGAGALALGGSRPAMRSILLTEPVQNAMSVPPSYARPGFRTLQDILNEIGVEAGMAGTAAGQ